jgi:predicted pyridoxine 5'-phosphate oxidase superfamily flavin-nucleotide-binding protein
MTFLPTPAEGHQHRPGSAGEHALQAHLGTTTRADRFYRRQVLDHLNPRMREFVARQKMMFVATSDATGECDNTLRAGPAGFVEVLDPMTVVWPEFKGNGVLASLGNITENPHVGLLMVDFVQDIVGLHINGRATLVDPARMREAGIDTASTPERPTEIWVRVDVEEAYIHCSKHIPRLAEVPPDEADALGPVRTADYFGISATEAADEPGGERPAGTERVLELHLQRDGLSCR